MRIMGLFFKKRVKSLYLYYEIFTCTPKDLWVRDTKHILILGVGGKSIAA